MSEYPDYYSSLFASEAALGIFCPPRSSSGSNQQSMSASAQPPSSAPSYDQPSLQPSFRKFVNESIDYPFDCPPTWGLQSASGLDQPSASSVPSSSSRRAGEVVDLTSESPSTRGQQSASGFDQPSALSAPSSSRRSADKVIDLTSVSPPAWGLQSAPGFLRASGCGQSSTIGSPLISFRQPLSVPNEPAISTPRSGQSVVWDDFDDFLVAQTPPPSSPSIMTDPQPEIEIPDPKQLMTTPAIPSTWDPQPASGSGAPSADGRPSTIERPIISSETPPRQPGNQASAPSRYPPSNPTVSINFITGSVRPFANPGGYCPRLKYISYHEISTDITVSLLVSALCQRHGPMFGVTVTVERGGGIWDAGMTVIADTEMAEKTLAELGWGREEKTVWLIAKRF